MLDKLNNGIQKGEGMRRPKGKVFGSILLVASLLLAAFSSAAAIELDGDSKDELVIFRPAFSATDVSSVWAVSPSSSGYSTTMQYQWGLQGDFPVAGKFTSTSGSDLTVWRPTDGTWFIRHFDTGLNFSTSSAYQWGLLGDTPKPCDTNGDGLDDLVVFRNSNGTWYIRNSDLATPANSFSTATSLQWGLPGDTAAPGDFDTDGTCDATVFRNGDWYVVLSSTGNATAGVISWGAAGDVPVQGNYDGDSILDFAVYRENASGGPLWLARLSTIAGLTSTVVQWGLAGDLPVPMDYDGDGKTDIAVYRPSNQTWYIRTSSSNYASAVSIAFGVNSNDIPVGVRRGTDPS